MRTPRVLTWHVHGSYLWYLSHADAEFFLPVKPGRPEGYGGRTPSFPWPANVHEVDASTVADLELDCILFQSRRNLEVDQFEIRNRKDGPRHPDEAPAPVHVGLIRA